MPDHERKFDDQMLRGQSPLAEPDWRYVEPQRLHDFSKSDWARLDAQRPTFQRRFQADHVLAMLKVGETTPTFGYQVNNFRHCLQTATMAMRDGWDEETVVVSLLHDIGFITCPDTHAEFAAALLGPWCSDRLYWMLRRHAIFQEHHCHTHPDLDPTARERWRGHPHFAFTAEWVAKYDQTSMDPAYDTAPLSVFEPMVHRFFAKPPRPIPFVE